MSQYGEPWRAEDFVGELGGNGTALIDAENQEVSLGHAAERIVACVNFCRNLATEQLSGLCIAIPCNLCFEDGATYPIAVIAEAK